MKMKAKNPLRSAHFIILLVGSIIFFWWFNGAGLICAGFPESPQDYVERIAKMPPVEQKLESLIGYSDEISGDLRLITARSRVIFAYLIFVVLVFGHHLLIKNSKVVTEPPVGGDGKPAPQP